MKDRNENETQIHPRKRQNNLPRQRTTIRKYEGVQGSVDHGVGREANSEQSAELVLLGSC